MFTTPGGYRFSGIHLCLDTFNATVLGCWQILPIASGNIEVRDLPPESKIQGVLVFEYPTWKMGINLSVENCEMSWTMPSSKFMGSAFDD